jgi:hypothetical protein
MGSGSARATCSHSPAHSHRQGATACVRKAGATPALCLALGIVASLLAAGCGGDSTFMGTVVPDAAPDSRVTGTPPVLAQTEFTVHFFWTGSDRDGWIDHFQWRISNNGRDGKVDVTDTLGLRWHRTAVTDSVFVVQADLDSFSIDVADPRQDPHSYRAWQTHTFFLRAVDNDGVGDPTPATVSFTATTLTPIIAIDIPAAQTTTSCVSAARVLTFGWTGQDPDAANLEPASVRYLLYEVPGCYTRTQYERENPLASVPDALWSPWIPYRAAQDSGRIVTLRRQDLLRSFFFAVQAKDVAGAVTPTLEWGENVRHVQIADGNRPLLTVSEPFLGTFDFSGPGTIQSFEIVSGQPLQFSWTAGASSYAGIVEAFRYGWEVQDYNDSNDPGWAVGWGLGELYRRANPRSFGQGTPNFVVQVRDNSGTVTRAIFQFDVIQVARRDEQRDLLLVQDWPRGNTALESNLERKWDDRWNSLLLGRVTNFDRGTDVLDTHDDPTGFTFRRLNNYKGVIYFNKGSDFKTQFHELLAPLSTTATRYNWFEVYQARVGNVLFCGPQSMNGTIEFNPPVWRLPVVFNVPDGGDLGFGTALSVDGSTFNRGTLRYPYTAWCLEAIDSVRPAPGQIFGELIGAGRLRTRECDAMVRAVVDDDFLNAYPSARGEVNDLRPTSERDAQFGQTIAYYQFDREEFYNANVTRRDVSLSVRSCQQTMYRLRARREEGWVDRPDSLCFPEHRLVSSLDHAPVAIASTVYAQTKQLPGAEDYLWGFHPLAFDLGDLRSALLWILRERWHLSTQ